MRHSALIQLQRLFRPCLPQNEAQRTGSCAPSPPSVKTRHSRPRNNSFPMDLSSTKTQNRSPMPSGRVKVFNARRSDSPTDESSESYLLDARSTIPRLKRNL